MAEHLVITRVANGWVLKAGDNNSTSREERPTFIATTTTELVNRAQEWAVTTLPKEARAGAADLPVLRQG